MTRFYLGILFITCFVNGSPKRVRRFSDYDYGDVDYWSWDRNEQFADAQTKTSSKVNWPSNEKGGSTKGRGDSNPNRDGSWVPGGKTPGENRNDDYDMGWNTKPQGNNKGSAYPDGDEDQGGNLETILRGVPGMDFPNFVTVPATDFDCASMPSQGYYGDVEAGCQVFHICQPGNRKDSFLCPVGTIFNQKYFVCDWWFNVNCNDTLSYYDLNNEVYRDPDPVTEQVPATTEKNLPWNSGDLDRKSPTKSWGNQPSGEKQNSRWKDTPTRRGSKSSDTVSTSRDVSNTWSRSDVQKEVTLTWGTASGIASGTFGSSSTSSNSFITTAKPIWYGIDGQPAKDQSDVMAKRVGLVQPPAPFGTRIRSSTAESTGNTWTSVGDVETTTAPLKSVNHGTTTTSIWVKGRDIYGPSTTTKDWMRNDVTDVAKRDKGHVWNNDINYDHSTTKGWLKSEDIPETSINPTGIKGVWEQQTTRRSDDSNLTDMNSVRHKGLVSKAYYSEQNDRKIHTVSNEQKAWTHRRTLRNIEGGSATGNRKLAKNGSANRRVLKNRNANNISRSKNWK